MEDANVNTEQLILDAAIEIFLDKGFAVATMTEIAKKAGVNHALLHYYFRTKENLFNKVFEYKTIDLLNVFKESFKKNLPFIEKIKELIEAHFDFIVSNPKVPMFIIREVIANKEKRDFIIKQILPAGIPVSQNLENMILSEVEKGNIQPIKPVDLILNIASLNVMSFVMAQAYYSFDDMENEDLKQFLDQRRKNNVETILKSLQK
jgi:AcrR family transcriptional regulator